MSRILRAHLDEPDMRDVNWEVFVIDDPKEFNAFVVPGGKVFVFTGILKICKDEEGLATVLGHEIAHVRAHHIAEKMSQGSIKWIGMIVSFFLLGGAGSFFNTASHFAMELPHSRIQE
ncbi:metalloendopeptidase, partial [Ascosphaera atra]